MNANIFEALFTYRQRPDRSSEENYLTTSWACALLGDTALCRRFVALCFGDAIAAADIEDAPIVETQVTYAGPSGGNVYPDLRICFRTKDGRTGVILFEHKWNSPVNVDQLRTYADLPAYGILKRLLFVCADERQRQAAVPWCDKALLWRELHDWIGDDGGATAQQFRQFVRTQGLAQTAAPSETVEYNETYGELMAAQLAQDRFSWSALPQRLRNCRRLMGARKRQVGIDFGDAQGPIIFAGYFFTGNVQPVAMCDQKTGIDLVAVLFRKPGPELPWELVQSIEHRLRAKDREASVLSGKQARHAWIVLSVRRALSDITPDKKADESELFATYDQLHLWCETIFSDPQVEATMRETWKTGW